MATKGNGSGSEVLEVLVGIHDEIRGLRGDTNARFERLETSFERLEGSFKRLEGETHDGFTRLTSRLDGIRDIAGSRYRDLETRVRRLEKRVG